MSSESLKLVNQRVPFQMPSQICHNLKMSGLSGIDHILQHETNYHRQQENKRNRGYDNGLMTSGMSLLESLGENYRQKTIIYSNIRALAIYISAYIHELLRESNGVTNNATYRTNSAGMHLFRVLAEFDGTGVPLAYLVVEKHTSDRIASTGAITYILDQVLRPLLESELEPYFSGCVKDKSEIKAIQQIWPSAKVQLCFWHAKRAIQVKLKDFS